MSSRSVPAFPDLAHANEEAQKAATLLETATHNLTHYTPDEGHQACAQRLRGAAILATTAALEVMNVAGWHEASARRGGARAGVAVSGDGVVPGSRRPPLTCPSSFPRKWGPRVLGALKPRGLTASDARITLERVWQDVTLVADWLRAEHPAAHVACKLSVRVVYSGLLGVDRVVCEIDMGDPRQIGPTQLGSAERGFLRSVGSASEHFQRHGNTVVKCPTILHG